MHYAKGHFAILAYVLILACCDTKPQQKVTYSIECGTTVSALSQAKTIESLRSEIQSFVHNSWKKNNGSQTDWIEARSAFVGGTSDANQTFGLDTEQELDYSSVRSTPRFRLVKKDTGSTFLELQRDGKIIEQGHTNSQSWTTISYLTESLLNDSLMRSLLTNKG